MCLGVALVFTLAAARTDLLHRRIPNRLVITGFFAEVAIHLIQGGGRAVAMTALVAISIAAPLAALSIARPRGFGMGDSKLIALIAFALGPPALIAIVIGLCLTPMWFVRPQSPALAEGIPLAPFLAAGVAAAGILG